VFNIIKIHSNLIILGLSWLKRYNPFTDWKLSKVTFPIEHFLIEFARKFETTKSLFIGPRAFIKIAEKRTSYGIYATPIC